MKEKISADNQEKIEEELQKEFPPEDIEWRVGPVNENEMQGIALAYITNRAIQSRLDNVFGTFGWKNEYKPWHGESQLCGLSVKFMGHDGKSEWITKWDGAENTKYESIKGGLSDSMKRTAVQFGIGRYLYKMPTIWVNVTKRGKNYYITDEDKTRLDNMLKSNKWKEWIKKHGAFDFDPAGNIKKDMDVTSSGNSTEKENNQNKKSDPATPKQKDMLKRNMKSMNLTEEAIEKMDKDTANSIIKDIIKKSREAKKNNNSKESKSTDKKEDRQNDTSSKKSSTAQKAIKNSSDKKESKSSAKPSGSKISKSQLQYLESQLNKIENKDEIMNKLCNDYDIKDLASIEKSMFSKISLFIRKSA